MSTFAIAVVIILLSGAVLILGTLWAMLIVAGEADDRAELYWQSLERLSRDSSSHSESSSSSKYCSKKESAP